MGLAFYGKKTESAGTEILQVLPPRSGQITRMQRLFYTNGATAHTLNVLKAHGETLASAAQVAADTTLTIDRKTLAKDATGADEDLAASDYIVWEDEDGVYRASKIQSISGFTLTLTAALSFDIKKGARVFAMMETGRQTAVVLDLPASSTNLEIPGPITSGFSKQVGAKMGSKTGIDQPLLLVIDNGTNAGTVDSLYGTFVESASSQPVG